MPVDGTHLIEFVCFCSGMEVIKSNKGGQKICCGGFMYTRYKKKRQMESAGAAPNTHNAAREQ